MKKKKKKRGKKRRNEEKEEDIDHERDYIPGPPKEPQED